MTKGFQDKTWVPIIAKISLPIYKVPRCWFPNLKLYSPYVDNKSSFPLVTCCLYISTKVLGAILKQANWCGQNQLHFKICSISFNIFWDNIYMFISSNMYEGSFIGTFECSVIAKRVMIWVRLKSHCFCWV